MRTAIQDLITVANIWDELPGDIGLVGRSILDEIKDGKYLEKEKDQTNRLLKMLVHLKEICENEVPEFNIPELNQIITDYEPIIMDEPTTITTDVK